MFTYQQLITLALVEDERLIREGFAKLLMEMPGCRVLFTAEHGKQLPGLIAEHGAPHVALLDVGMPGMNGYETAAWLRRHHPDTRILALSGMSPEHVPDEMLKAGAHGFVPKGVSPDELETAIRTVRASGWYVHGRENPEIRKLAQMAKLTAIQQRLTPKRREFLLHLKTGMTYAAIAGEMGITVSGVNKHVNDCYRIFGARSRVEVVVACFQLGLFNEDHVG